MDLAKVVQYYDEVVGVKTLELENGFVKTRVALKSEELNHLNIAGGGSIYNIADITAGLAFMSDGITKGVTASGNIEYFRGARNLTELYCEARVEKRGHQVDFVKAAVMEPEGKVLAEASFVYCRIDEEKYC